MRLVPLCFQACFTVQKVPWSGRYLAYIFICLVSPMLCTLLNSFSPRWLFVFYVQVSLICLDTTILSFCLLSLISPCSHFITYVIGLLWYPFSWSSFSQPMDNHMVSHHSFICLQAASKACTESVPWHGSESDLVPCVLSILQCHCNFSPQASWWRCVSQVSFFCLDFQHLFLLGPQIAAFPCTLINGPYKYRPWSTPSNLSTSKDGCKYLPKTTTHFRAILFQLILFFPILH